jgi:hypothetical protein
MDADGNKPADDIESGGTIVGRELELWIFRAIRAKGR